MPGPETKPPEPEATAKPAPPAPTSAIGKFLARNNSVLSTTVLGAAGLAATSLWQYRQSEISRHQAESQQQIARTQADNQWRIERAEILSKNLQILASRGPDTAEQRYGVLLSLTRGAILDPELAVSYALELGRDNPDYMKSVLASTSEKDYLQLAHAFTLTCDQRFGLSRQIDACKTDNLIARDDAIGDTVADDVDLWLASSTQSPPAGGPIGLLTDERRVQKDVFRLAWIFTPTINRLYQKKQISELGRLESVSTGAHLITALVVPTQQTGEVSRGDGGDAMERLHKGERIWLADYVLGRTCDEDCRGRVAEIMLTGLADAQGDFDDTLRRLIERPAAEAGPTMERLHTRFVRCQVIDEAATAFRDRLLVPALRELADKKPAPATLESIVALAAVVPEPTDPVALSAWTDALAKLQKASPERRKSLDEQRVRVAAQQKTPPAALKKVSFCHALAIDLTGGLLEP